MARVSHPTGVGRPNEPGIVNEKVSCTAVACVGPCWASKFLPYHTLNSSKLTHPSWDTHQRERHQGAQRAQEWGHLIVVRFGEALRRRFLCTPLDMLFGLVRARCFAHHEVQALNLGRHLFQGDDPIPCTHKHKHRQRTHALGLKKPQPARTAHCYYSENQPFVSYNEKARYSSMSLVQRSDAAPAKT